MKICLYTLDITLLGGIERVVTLLANSFKEIGYEVEVVSIFKSNPTVSYPLNKNISIRYLTSKSFANGSIKDKVKTYSTIFSSLHKTVKNDKVIIISTLLNISCFFSLLKFYKSNIKVIAAEHSQYYAHGKLSRFIRLLAYNNVDKIVTLTKNDLSIFSEKFKNNKIVQIPNPVSFDINISSALKYERLISIGRLEKVKGYDKLLKDVQEFLLNHPSWTLQIYGEGSQRPILEKIIREYGLEAQVSLCGFSQELNNEIRNSSIYLCSSLTEAFPMSFLEANSVGMPVISYDCPIGPSELIHDNQNGFLLGQQHLFTSFTKALEFLINNESKYELFVENCSDSIKKYQIELITEKWSDLFKELYG